jgi:hypothetical protein
MAFFNVGKLTPNALIHVAETEDPPRMVEWYATSEITSKQSKVMASVGNP